MIYMKRLERLYSGIMLVFLFTGPVLARKCCKVPVSQSQLGCINADIKTILNKISEIIINVDEGCGLNIVPIAQSDIPYTIPSAGHYCLQEDVTAVGANAITNTQNNVTLDLNGFHITGGTNGIASSGSDVAIFGGTIQNATSHGISLTGGSGVSIESVVLRTNGGNGLNDTGASNVHVSDSSAIGNTGVGFNVTADNHTFNNVIANENGGNGLTATGNTLTIHTSTFEQNGGDGVEVSSLVNFCIENSTLQRNSANGFEGSGTSTTGLIEENCIIGNTDKGITLEASTTQSCQIIDNKVIGNGAGQGSDGFGIDIGGGIFLAAATGTTARSHEVFGNFAKNNGNNPADINAAGNDTNYSNDVQASPNGVPSPPNGLVKTPAAASTRFENMTT
jgi:Right handed beta helix region